MREQEVRELYEAYLQVHQPQEEVEQLDEAITSEKGKKKAAEMIAARSTPSGRAKKGQGANVAQIKHIGRANVDGYGGTPPNRKVAKNPVKSNFTGLNSGTGNKAARRAAELNKEAFELWVNALVEEGYDLSDYTWEDMCEMYLDEAPKGLPYGPVGKGFKKLPAGPKRNKMMKREKDYTKKAMDYASREGEAAGEDRQKMGRISSALTNPRLREETDLFDYILEHLVAEGYADTNKAALAIMANMSEEWKQSIFEETLDERNRGEQGMSDREVTRRRNLGGNTRSTVSSGALGDHGSQGAIQKFHKGKQKSRQAIHKSGRYTRGDTGESGGKGRYEANKDHADGYPSITKRGQGPG